MSILPPTACRTPGCSGHVASNGRCENCQIAPGLKHDHHREWSKLYHCKRWHMLRAAVLRRDPICKKCNRDASTLADHIRDHRGNLILFYDINNLQGLCKPCHDDKTGSEHGGGGRTSPAKPSLENGCIRDYPLEIKQ